MNILNGMSKVNALSIEKKRAFELYYHRSMQTKFLPLMADFSLAVMLIGTFFWAIQKIASLDTKELTWSTFHPLTYFYWSCLVAFALLNQIQKIRHRAPLILYITTLLIMTLSYRNFILQDGSLDPIFGLFFYTAFFGISMGSVRHVAIIQSVNITFLCVSFLILSTAGDWLPRFLLMLSNWFIFNCLLMSFTTAVFSRWLFRNIFAIQFLLNDKNEMLSLTLRTLKTTEQQLIQQQKHQALSHMAKGLLHEVINPVNSASQAVGFAKSINHDEDINEALDEAILQHQRISDIITDLRKFSQSESNHELESVSVEHLVTTAVKFCQREIDKAGTQVILNLAEEQFIDCHSSALTQVFVNLLLNSCNALARKPPEQLREITISSYEQPETISICFHDNGVGIHKDMLHSISDPFFSDGNSPENMGLGLSICQTIMRHHKGTVEIRSQVNEWTEIVLTLPAHIKLVSAPITSPLGKDLQKPSDSKQKISPPSSNYVS